MAKVFKIPDPPSKPPPPPPEDGWGARIENMISRAFISIVTPLYSFISGMITSGINDLLEDLEASLLDQYKDDIESLIDSDALPPEVAKMLRKSLSGEKAIGLAIAGALAMAVLMASVGAAISPLLRLGGYKVERKLSTARADPSTALPLAFRNPDLDQMMNDSMSDLGWSEDFQEAFRETLRPILPEASLTSLWFRFPEMRADIEGEFTKRGWTRARIDNLILSNRIYPGVQDTILFAVRDVFSPDIVDRFGLDAEFPAAFGEEVERLGLADGAADLFWKSHWVLPGASAGYQMFHRLRPGRTDNPFTKDDLNFLLKALDFSPFWRGRLAEIAETLPTRVDIRSMLRTGVIDRDTAFESYKDRGYNDFWAKALTDFAALGGASAEKDLTRSAIQTGYRRGVFDFDEAKTALLELGFDESESDFWLSLVDWQIQQELLDEETKVAEKLYVAGDIQAPDVVSLLGALNMPTDQINRLLTLWDLKREQKVKFPTKAELDGWYKRDLIDGTVLLSQLTNLGWDTQRIGFFIQELDLEKAEFAAKEAERAQIEQERSDASEMTTAYQKDKAVIDLRIALLRLELADLRVASNATDDPDLKAEYAERSLDLKVVIADEQVEKAELKVDLTAI